MLAVEHDPPHLERYGVVALADDGLHVTDIVEKPAPGTEPSRDASIGRYLYTPEIYRGPAAALGTPPGRRIQLHRREWRTWRGQGRVVICRMIGRRLDIGTPAGYLRSILEYAARDPELAAEIASFRAKPVRTTLSQCTAPYDARRPAVAPPTGGGAGHILVWWTYRH